MMTSPEEKDIKTAEPESPADDALNSFLSREQEQKKPKKANKKFNRGMIILLAAVIVVAVLAGVIIMLANQPYPESKEDIYKEASYSATVDEAGVHTAQVPTTTQGEPVQNGGGTLLSYAPADIARVEVSQASGAGYTVVSHKHGDTTEYSLEGFEDLPLQTGMTDTVANDAAGLTFSAIASTGGNKPDYGLDRPRATVNISYNDDTSARILIGSEAPAGAGTYISFGDSGVVYLVSGEAVDAFFYKLTDFVSLSVTEDAQSVDDADFTRLKLSGSNYPKAIVIEPNDDSAVNYSYKMVKPDEAFVSPSAGADATGSVRGLYADETAGVYVSKAELDGYGLGDDHFAQVEAEYPDGTIRLRCSAPDDKGDVYLINLDFADIVYKVQVGKLGWATVTQSALTADTVLSVNREALDEIAVSAGGRSWLFDIKTQTQSVENTDGGYEDVTYTEAFYKDERLSEDIFNVLFNNLANLPRKNGDGSSAGAVFMEIRYSYTTGRPDDVITIYESGSADLPAALNGKAIGTTKKSYAEALLQSVKDAANGKIPDNI